MLEINNHPDYIRINFIGTFSMEAARQTVDTILETCTSKGQLAVVLDCSSMTGKLSIMDRYRVILYGQKLIGKVSRLALVADIKMVFPDRFAEMVAQNRGINLKVFSDIEGAVHWITH